MLADNSSRLRPNAAPSYLRTSSYLFAGSLTTLSPCVSPLLPLVLGGALQGSRLAPLAMGLGMTASFAGIGMLLGALGPALGIDGDTVRTGGAALLIAFALVMLVPALGQRFTQWMLPIASTANAASARLDGGSLSGALLLGGVLGLVWSPCSGPLLGSALTLVASEGGVARGGVVLGIFGLGAAVPLVAVAYASRSGFLRARDWVLARIEPVRLGFALLLGAMGIAILTGGDKWLESQLLQWLPDAWVNLTVGI
ncbi:MAG: cytochrome c biogenesis protein CcdA [Rhodoferax sp.]|uniref:cytochrome c biogenesis CcdA family protein n=1 Tax=Rhodoferax sp. TaxID=50421 RepID=UPI002611ED6B|nr:cytochrome c biogenesis protein CcdA [Rhodoferax sp.]MDD5336496.1 cytochrome c biogenesis protein CcdA [Rhodoferax sp.]